MTIVDDLEKPQTETPRGSTRNRKIRFPGRVKLGDFHLSSLQNITTADTSPNANTRDTVYDSLIGRHHPMARPVCASNGSTPTIPAANRAKLRPPKPGASTDSLRASFNVRAKRWRLEKRSGRKITGKPSS